MKKTIALILLAALLATPVFAESVDLSALDDSMLIQLQTDITAEMLERGMLKSMKVPTGEYIIGEDIPAGIYGVTTEVAIVAISNEDYTVVYTVQPDAPVGKMELREGQKMQFTGAVTLTKYTGLKFE